MGLQEAHYCGEFWCIYLLKYVLRWGFQKGKSESARYDSNYPLGVIRVHIVLLWSDPAICQQSRPIPCHTAGAFLLT